ncbi:DUF4136 domain-containing protein [Algoriphagus jejuensis]|uniref:DUF4136 domain-containing protein n=1 Tax=Algoriphagus jejuensis TaxID=419934 RepID=A0ABP3YE86_9BACT
MIKFVKRISFGLLLVSGLIACSPEGATFVEEQDVVYTNYNPAFDFKSQSTYSLPDEVISISNGGIAGDSEVPEFLPPQFANPILATLRSNMNALGYREVDESASPDIVLLPSALQTTEVYYYYDWWYWNWYYPGGGGGWYYPGYYPPTVTAVRSGSVFVQMTNPKDVSGSNEVAVNWIAIVNGLLEGEGNGADRIDRTLDQAFTQSPYLQK